LIKKEFDRENIPENGSYTTLKSKRFSFKFYVDNKSMLIDTEHRNDEKRIAYFLKT
jgi:hypothetical protein